MDKKQIKEYQGELLKSVFESMMPEEKDIILKYFAKVSFVHLGAQEILKHLKNIHKGKRK